MNLRALVLGAVFGFLLALTPSCTGSSTCDGCVDESGACVKLRDVSEAVCGVEGAACAPCGAGQSCVAGICAAPDAGPQQNTCREPCPGGCCDANGECQECKGLGASCTADSECKLQLGQTAFCKLHTSSGLGTYTGGYCTTPCTQANPCQQDGICVPATALGFYGEDDNFCMASCPNATECRETEKYACYNFGSSQQPIPGCWIDPPPPRDGGTPLPSGVAGRACTDDSACAPADPMAFCQEATMADGGASGFPEGLCTAVCANTFEPDGGQSQKCGPNGVCPFDDFCYGRCTAPGGGQGDPAAGGCRPSYVCRTYPLLNSRGEVTGISTDGFCDSACDVPGPGCGDGGLTCITEGADKGYCRWPDGGVLK